MKILVRALIAVALVTLIVLASRAANTTLLGSMASVDGTSNSVATAIGTVAYPRGTFLIQHGGLASTNALLVHVQMSLDNTNFVTVATYGPSATNATTETFSPAYSAATVYMRVQAVTTNAVDVGTTYQN